MSWTLAYFRQKEISDLPLILHTCSRQNVQSSSAETFAKQVFFTCYTTKKV